MKYKIRPATPLDINPIRQIIRESVAEDKKLINPSVVNSGFIEEFADKTIKKGNMVVVENTNGEIILIGEVHQYDPTSLNQHGGIKELSFISGKNHDNNQAETELVNWLYGEIRTRHRDVFRVEVAAQVCNPDSVAHFRRMGLRVEGNFYHRLANTSGFPSIKIPLSWINAA